MWTKYQSLIALDLSTIRKTTEPEIWFAEIILRRRKKKKKKCVDCNLTNASIEMLSPYVPWSGFLEPPTQFQVEEFFCAFWVLGLYHFLAKLWHINFTTFMDGGPLPSTFWIIFFLEHNFFINFFALYFFQVALVYAFFLLLFLTLVT